MNAVHAHFNQRKTETDLYFSFLKTILQEDSTISFQSNNSFDQVETHKVDLDVKVSLKANAFLILYNLVESTIEKCIIQLLCSITENNVTYQTASSEIRRFWTREKIKASQSSSLETLVRAVEKILDLTSTSKALEFDLITARRLYQGNLTPDTVRDLTRKFGFEIKCSPEAKGGSKLTIVTAKRNDLAHGTFSFVECGRDFSFDQLNEMRRELYSYLDSVIASFNKFIASDSFCNCDVN